MINKNYILIISILSLFAINTKLKSSDVKTIKIPQQVQPIDMLQHTYQDFMNGSFETKALLTSVAVVYALSMIHSTTLRKHMLMIATSIITKNILEKSSEHWSTTGILGKTGLIAGLAGAATLTYDLVPLYAMSTAIGTAGFALLSNHLATDEQLNKQWSDKEAIERIATLFVWSFIIGLTGLVIQYIPQGVTHLNDWTHAYHYCTPYGW
jgi:hypothetical protein